MESKKVGTLFGYLLLRKYPEIEGEGRDITLDDLLAWSYWPSFIKIYSKCGLSLNRTLVKINILSVNRGRFKAEGRSA